MQRPLAQPSLLFQHEDAPSRSAVRFLRQYLSDMVQVLNTATQGVGLPLASAATLKPTNAIHHVTGVVTVNTIVAPPGFTGPLMLISDDGFGMSTAGNISVGGTTTPGTKILLTYDGATWYPIQAASTPAPSTISVVTVDTTYAVGATDTVILGDTTPGAFTVTLPAAAASANRLLYVKNIGASAELTLDGAGGDTIDGELTQSVLPKNTVVVVCDGIGWYIV